VTEATEIRQQDAATLPWDWYTDPAVQALEVERIFRRSWHYVGHLGQLADAGDLLPGVAGGVPVLVCRDREGALRAFLNVCRHRGALLVEEPCQRASIQCPYHAWTYGLDGALRAAPRSADEPGFDREALGLVPLDVDAWGPFVFVHAGDDPEPLADALGDLPDVVAESGLDVDRLRFHARYRTVIQANWKIAIENYLECYHCAVNHPGLVQVLDERRYVLDVASRRLSQSAPPREEALRGEGPLDAGGTISQGQFHLLFPSFKFNVEPGRPNLSIGPLWPTAPDRCEGFLDYFFGEDVEPAWIEAMLAFDDQVGREDVHLVEAAQRGMANGLLGQGRLLLGSERLIASFQALVREALAGSVDARLVRP
jgi:choline monooxygenase